MISLSTLSWKRFAIAAAVALAVSASSAEAQRPVPVKPKPQTQGQQRRDQIVPPGFFPPAGMCRIWLNDVPPGQQPAPTDCTSAVRNRPSNGKVLFGDDSKSKRGKSDKKSKTSSTDEIVDLITRRISR